jgi:hypothetical protein
MLNSLIPYKINSDQNLISSIANTNRAYLYKKGYFILWNYNKIQNFFITNSPSWVNEEEKRIFEFRYWANVENPYKINSKEWVEETRIRKLDSFKKIQYDLKNYILFINILYNNIKYHFKYNLYIYPFFLEHFEKETRFVFDNKDYKEIFLKQNTLFLKKFDVLKKYIIFNNIKEKSLNIDKENIAGSFIFYYIDMHLELFPYLYMLPSFNEEVLKDSSGSFFKFFFKKYISIYFLETWFGNIISGLKDFFFFLKVRFFYFDFTKFLKKIIKDKFILSNFFQKKINEKVLEDEKYYMLLLNKNIDPAGFSYLNNYSLWDYLHKENLFENVDEELLYSNALSYFETSLFYELDKDVLSHFFLQLNSKDYSDIKKDINLKLIDFTGSISDSYFYRIFNIKLNVSEGFLNNFIQDGLALNKFSLKMENLKLDNFYLTDEDYLKDLLKILYYNPTASRSFFIEKIMNIKSQGNLKFYNSYLIFLKKYFFINFFTFFYTVNNLHKFKGLVDTQYFYNSFKNFSGLKYNVWFYISSDLEVEHIFENLFYEFLKVGSVKESYLVNNKYFLNRSSSGFLKYSVDFSLKLFSNVNFEFVRESDIYFNGYSGFLNMFFNLFKIRDTLVKIK